MTTLKAELKRLREFPWVHKVDVKAQKWLSLIAAIEVACENLKNVGCYCLDECKCEHLKALAKIEQLIVGEKKEPFSIARDEKL